MKKSFCLLLASALWSGCSDSADDAKDEPASNNPENSTPAYTSPDMNGDNAVNILVLGTNLAMDGMSSFSPDSIATELQTIVAADSAFTGTVNIVAEDIHQTATVTFALGSAADEYSVPHHSHSLAQYYYWPAGQDARMDRLMGNGEFDWDYVVIGADPYIVANTPGYYALGVNKVAAKVTEGGAQPLLLMIWPKDDSALSHFEEYIYRTGDNAQVSLPVVPAGLGWAALPDAKKDEATTHPTPNGAYLSAAAIYAYITGFSASTVDYEYDTEIADIAASTVSEQASAIHYDGSPTFDSPFKSCGVTDDTISYVHTGTSTENGILAGLNWVFDQSPRTLENGGDASTFNYGRANTNFEANKRYQVDPERFDFSFGFPMQDHGNTGDVSMLYGLDRREWGVANDTDMGVARYMIEQSEVPYARAIPMRTLYAQLKEIIPDHSAYRDNNHIHRNLDKAIAGYMYTMLTGDCALGEEPTDNNTDEWKQWTAHKLGCDTAWTVTTYKGSSPF